MMDSSSDSASFAHISLTAAGPSSSGLSFPERRLVLSSTNDKVVVGRASKTPAKGFLSGTDNAWFDSAVMSRHHAEIKADFKEMKVKIRDLGSLHGTYVNDHENKIPSHEPRELQNGDSVRFGVGVWRSTENFVPTTVKVGITFDHRTQRASSTFQVPEDSDNESDVECLSNNGNCAADDTEPIIIMEGKRFPEFSETIDLTGHVPVTLISDVGVFPVDTHKADVIDLSSPPQSPSAMEDDYESDSDSIFEVSSIPPNVAKASTTHQELDFASEVVEDDIDDEDADRMSYCDRNSEDDEISVDYGSEEESELEFSDSDAGSSDEGAEQTTEIDGLDHEASDMDESEEEQEDPQHCIGELDETSDEEDPTDPFWKPADSLSFNLSPKQVTGLATATETPMKSTHPVTIIELLNNDEEPRQLFARPPSPSDIMMSKSFLHPIDVSEAKSGAELLGQKSGKPEYFEAREENKIAVQKKATLSSVHSLCNDDHPASGNLGFAETIGLHAAAMDRGFGQPHLSSHLGPLNILATEATAASAATQVPKGHAEKTTAAPITPANGVDISRRTRLGISDIVDSFQKVPDEGKAKRKAREISTLSEEEAEWDKPTQGTEPNPVREVSPISMDTNQTEVELPALPKTDFVAVVSIPESRAPKRRRLQKIAERVGYAALGGVTAGAMIVGTLIYTAPTF